MNFIKLIKSFDYILLASVGLILLVGLFVLQSATVNISVKLDTNFVLRQIAWIVIGTVAFFIVMQFDYSKLFKYGIYFYLINIILLVSVLIFGSETKGAQAWIPIGPFKFQPAELVKAFLILGLAQFLTPRIGKLKSFKSLLPVFIYVGIPLLLILKQPDLGTGLV